MYTSSAAFAHAISRSAGRYLTKTMKHAHVLWPSEHRPAAARQRRRT